MTKPYRLGLYEKALPDTLTWEQKLMETHICGFDWLEISIDESQPRLDRLTMSKKERASLRNLSFQLETPISTMCLSGHRRYPLGSHDTCKRNKALEIMRRAIELAGDLGVRVIQLAGYDVYYETADDSTRGWFLENLFQCVHMAQQYGMLLGFETMETSFMDTVSKAMAYVDCVASPYLGIYPDIGNLKNAHLLYGSDMDADLKAGKGHILAAHLKETRPNVYRNLFFGDGHTEYVPCVHALYSMGVRMFTAEFWCTSAETDRSRLLQASLFLTRQIDQAVSTCKEE